MRKVLAIAAGAFVLVVVNWAILGHEQLLKSGQIALLELAPVDPRSLMQGDYMALRFKVSDQAFGRWPDVKKTKEGCLVVKLDEHNVASFVRFDNGTPLVPGEKILRYRIRGEQLKFATNAYFFQEGRAHDYDHARYGEFRVAPSGELLLAHLVDEKYERLGLSAGPRPADRKASH